MRKLITVILVIVVLSGCSKTVFDNEDIRCPFVDKGGCQSMQAINEMVNRNQYTADGNFVKQYVGSKKEYSYATK